MRHVERGENRDAVDALHAAGAAQFAHLYEDFDQHAIFGRLQLLEYVPTVLSGPPGTTDAGR